MHVLLQVAGDEYTVIGVSDKESDLLDKQQTNPLRIVVDSQVLDMSILSKAERSRAEKMILVATECSSLH